MLSSINDKVRNYIFKDTNFLIALKKIMCLDTRESEYVLRLLLSDYYKVCYTDNLIDGDSSGLHIFNYPIEHNISTCIKNRDFLCLILNIARSFYKEPLIIKTKIMDEMRKTEIDRKLAYINKFHLLDKISYEFSYNLNDLQEYYIDSIKSSIKNHYLTSEIISNKIIKLEYKNTDMYEEYIVEFIREYYKWNFFRKNFSKKDPKFNHDYDYLNKVRDCSIDILLYDASKKSEFLFTLVSDYLYYTSLSNSKEKEIVDKFFIENTSKELQKKLNIKRDFK